jgi:hypothetical protein
VCCCRPHWLLSHVHAHTPTTTLTHTGTQLEEEPLRCAYSATEDGWSAAAFHDRVDGYGATLIMARTQVGGGGGGGEVTAAVTTACSDAGQPCTVCASCTSIKCGGACWRRWLQGGAIVGGYNPLGFDGYGPKGVLFVCVLGVCVSQRVTVLWCWSASFTARTLAPHNAVSRCVCGRHTCLQPRWARSSTPFLTATGTNGHTSCPRWGQTEGGREG